MTEQPDPQEKSAGDEANGDEDEVITEEDVLIKQLEAFEAVSVHFQNLIGNLTSSIKTMGDRLASLEDKMDVIIENEDTNSDDSEENTDTE